MNCSWCEDEKQVRVLEMLFSRCSFHPQGRTSCRLMNWVDWLHSPKSLWRGVHCLRSRDSALILVDFGSIGLSELWWLVRHLLDLYLGGISHNQTQKFEFSLDLLHVFFLCAENEMGLSNCRFLACMDNQCIVDGCCCWFDEAQQHCLDLYMNWLMGLFWIMCSILRSFSLLPSS